MLRLLTMPSKYIKKDYLTMLLGAKQDRKKTSLM